MMTTIVERLANKLLLAEDLNSKMPVLRKQFPEYSEEDITAMSAADPTAPQSAEYITWLLKMRRAGHWDGSTEMVRPLLQRFHALKSASDFKPCPEVPMQDNEHKNILKYTSVEDLQKVLEFNKGAGNKAQKADKGVTPIAKQGEYTLLKIENKEAASKVAIGKGSSAHPDAQWCTKELGTAQSYLEKGPLFVLYKEGKPYVQVYFDLKSPTNSQCKDNRDGGISPAIAKEIAPVFASSPALVKLLETIPVDNAQAGVSDADVSNQVIKVKWRFFSERLNGVTNDGKKFKPLTKEQTQIRWNNVLPRLYESLLNAVKSGDYSMFERARTSGSVSASSETGALAVAVAALVPKKEGTNIPDSLKTLEAFVAFVNEVSKDIPD